MNTFTIDLSTVCSYWDLHECLKEVFSLPDGYGRNMDALWDLLHCAFEDSATIEVMGLDSVPKDLKEAVQRLRTVLTCLHQEDDVTVRYL